MKSFIKRGMSGLLAFLMCFTALFGAGSTTAFAASETSESYMISFPRDGDANQVYLAVVVCFAAFLANDLYGFLNWRRMEKSRRRPAKNAHRMLFLPQALCLRQKIFLTS